MKKKSVLLAAVVIAFSLGGTAQAGEGCPAAAAASAAKKPSVMKEAVVTATATVEAIDLKTRLVTLLGEEGNTFVIVVGPQAKNLSQVHVGDVVQVTYYEAVAVKVYKPGEAPPEISQTNVQATAKKGEMPGGMAASQMTVTATVQSIDKENQTAVLVGPEGNPVKVKVAGPEKS